MKSIYWRPQTACPKTLLSIGIVAVLGMTSLHHTRLMENKEPQVEELAAAQLTAECFQALKVERQGLGHVIDERFDPHGTGLIGEPISAATSKVANLSAKQVSVNPNFGAAVVRMLRETGVGRGDTVAIGWTGSFPALNVALCSAIETLELRPIIIASALSSQYGANNDDFLWLDMEQHLAESGLISFRSSAMTAGGAADRASHSSSETKDVLNRLQERTGVPWLAARRLRQSIDERMSLFDSADERPIAAYINVGGGIASMGGADSEGYLRAGVNRRIRDVQDMPDCVTRRFASAKVPVIHLAHARTLAKQYGLNVDLSLHATAGIGPAFERRNPSRAGAGLLLLAIGTLLHAFVTRDYGYRVLNWVMHPFRNQETAKKEFRIVAEPVISQLMV